MVGELNVSQIDLRCLEALYDAAADSDRIEALSVLEGAGLDFRRAQEWLVDARDRGLVADPYQTLVPSDRPTPEGRGIVEEARRRRSSRSLLRRVAQDRLLAWADDTDGGNVTGFMATDYAWVYGHTLTLEETADAARALHDDGLVKARLIGAWGEDVIRADVTILPRGREVVDEYDGDVAAWRASRNRPQSTISIEHNAGAIAVGGDGSTVHASVSMGIDAEALAQLVEALAAARGALGLDGNDARAYEDNLVDLQRDDPGRVRRALAWFGQLGTAIGANALGTILGAQALALLGS